MTFDSPVDYHCPTCKATPGEQCWDQEYGWVDVFHVGRRAARMAALARRSAPPDHRTFMSTEFVCEGPRRRVTTVKRPDPTLPLTYRNSDTAREVWERAIKDAVDRIFESMEVES